MTWAHERAAAADSTRAVPVRLHLGIGAARVVGPELIVGRAFDGRVAWLLVEPAILVWVEVQTERTGRASLNGLKPTDSPWGLARLSDGTFWTLLDRWTLGRIGEDGGVRQRVGLGRPHVGVYGWHDMLVYQSFHEDSRIVGVAVGPPHVLRRRPLHLTPAVTSDVADPEARSKALVNCGLPAPAELACWFPGERTVHFVREGRPVTHTVIDAGAPQDRSEAAGMAIWDAASDAGGQWILLAARSAALGDSNAAPGGVAILRRSNETLTAARLRLPAPARSILGVAHRMCYLLMSDGAIATVRLEGNGME